MNTVIDSTQSPAWIPWREMFQYRDLFRLLVRREVLTKYSQTLLGPIWFLLQPIITSFVVWIVFSQTLAIETAGVPAFLYYLSGLVLWGFVSQTVTQVSGSLQANAPLFKKVYFPRLFIPLSHVFASLIVLGIQFTLFVLCYAFWGKGLVPSLATLWVLPVVVLQVAVLALGLGLFVAAMTVRYRDFHHLLSFLMNLWFLLTPIGYSPDSFPEKYRALWSMNPLLIPMAALRSCFFKTDMVTLGDSGVGVLIALAVCFLGFLAFHRIEGTLVDKI